MKLCTFSNALLSEICPFTKTNFRFTYFCNSSSQLQLYNINFMKIRRNCECCIKRHKPIFAKVFPFHTKSDLKIPVRHQGRRCAQGHVDRFQLLIIVVLTTTHDLAHVPLHNSVFNVFRRII